MIDEKLHTFLSVAETLNFSRTAELLHMTQPAVTQQMNGLEAYYGVRLFSNRRKGMQLTEEGVLLLEYAREMNRLSQSVMMQLKADENRVRTYSVGATMTIGGYVLPGILGQYKKAHPLTDVKLTVENTESVLEEIVKGNLILGLVEGPFPKDKFHFDLLRKDELVVAVSPQHPLAEQDAVSMESLLAHPLILREEGSGTREVFENAVRTAGFSTDQMNVHMEIGNIHALVSLVESNLGATVISRDAISEALERGSLRAVSVIGVKIEREYCFVYLDDRISFIAEFIGFCKNAYKNCL